MGAMSILPVSVLQANAGHTFAQTDRFDEVPFEPVELLVDEVVGLVDEAECDVGYHFSGSCLHKFAVVFVCLPLLAPKLSHVARFLGFLVPDLKVASAEVVSIIVQQLLQARSRDVRQLDLHFPRSDRGLAAFEDVLFPRSRGLDHLVDRAVALGEMFVRKAKREIVDDLGFLEGEEGPVIAPLRQQRLMGGLGIMGIMGRIFRMIRMIRTPIVSERRESALEGDKKTREGVVNGF